MYQNWAETMLGLMIRWIVMCYLEFSLRLSQSSESVLETGFGRDPLLLDNIPSIDVQPSTHPLSSLLLAGPRAYNEMRYRDVPLRPLL